MAALPSEPVVDANVLYWIFYLNFESLSPAKGQEAKPRYSLIYSRFWQRAANSGAKFYFSGATLGEFSKLAEHAELEAIWLRDRHRPRLDAEPTAIGFNPRLCKMRRYRYADQLRRIRGKVEAMIADLRKSVALLPDLQMGELLVKAASTAWATSNADFPDAVMVTAAILQRRDSFLTHDADLATFPGIKVFTANNSLIEAAKTAGKLRAS